jgi:hypothetical protein
MRYGGRALIPPPALAGSGTATCLPRSQGLAHHFIQHAAGVDARPRWRAAPSRPSSAPAMATTVPTATPQTTPTCRRSATSAATAMSTGAGPHAVTTAKRTVTDTTSPTNENRAPLIAARNHGNCRAVRSRAGWVTVFGTRGTPGTAAAPHVPSRAPAPHLSPGTPARRAGSSLLPAVPRGACLP